MNRRTILAAAAFALVPFATLADPIDYTEGLVEKHLAAGETVFLDFKASWCTTCRAQERVLNQLKGDNAAYEEAITFINVDWDEFGRSDLVNRMNIPRRSTLVVLKGEEELGRIVAGTAKSEIQALMDVALGASS